MYAKIEKHIHDCVDMRSLIISWNNSEFYSYSIHISDIILGCAYIYTAYENWTVYIRDKLKFTKKMLHKSFRWFNTW